MLLSSAMSYVTPGVPNLIISTDKNDKCNSKPNIDNGCRELESETATKVTNKTLQYAFATSKGTTMTVTLTCYHASFNYKKK